MSDNKETAIWDRLKEIRAGRAAKGKDGGQMVASSDEVVVKEDDESQEDFMARVEETFRVLEAVQRLDPVHTEDEDSPEDDVDA